MTATSATSRDSSQAETPVRHGWAVRVLDDGSAWMLLAVAAVAPWFLGARWANHDGWTWAAAGLTAPIVLRFVLWAFQRRGPAVPLGALIGVLGLTTCLVYWFFQDDPPFATAFAAEHWQFMESRQASGILWVPRVERLTLSLTILMAGLAAADAAHHRVFQRRLVDAIGWGGLAAAGYSLGERWLHWHLPSWLVLDWGELDRWDGPYFHYSAAATALNIAWPLLVFRRGSAEAPTRWLTCTLALLIALLALPGWPAQAAWLNGSGLLVTGLAVTWLLKRGRLTARRSMLVLAGVFALIAVAQLAAMNHLRNHFPDHWQSAEQTKMDAPLRDEAVRSHALARGDRLVSSDAPVRPVAWLAAVRMARDYPLIGNGPGSWVKNAVLYSNEPIMNTFFHHRQFAHHDWLQMAAEWGVLPALVALALWAGALARGLGWGRALPKQDDLPAVLALVGLALHSLWNFPLQVPAIQLWSVLLLAALWARHREHTAARASSGS